MIINRFQCLLARRWHCKCFINSNHLMLMKPLWEKNFEKLLCTLCWLLPKIIQIVLRPRSQTSLLHPTEQKHLASPIRHLDTWKDKPVLSYFSSRLIAASQYVQLGCYDMTVINLSSCSKLQSWVPKPNQNKTKSKTHLWNHLIMF